MRDERQHRDDAREEKPEQGADQNNFFAQLQIIRLQEQHHFKTFAVKRRETKQHQPPFQTARGNFRFARAVQKFFFVAVMHRNPAAPINFVKKPVHHHEQYHDREQSRRRLQIQRGNALAKIADDAGGDEPSEQSADARARRADDDGPPLRRAFASHAGEDRSQNQDGFQAFAENQNRNVHHRRRRTGVRRGRIWISLSGDSLPDQHTDNDERANHQRNAERRPRRIFFGMQITGDEISQPGQWLHQNGLGEFRVQIEFGIANFAGEIRAAAQKFHLLFFAKAQRAKLGADFR